MSPDQTHNSDPTGKELEAALHENPEDAAAWAAYGAWLSSIGDARGELIELPLRPAMGIFGKKRGEQRVEEIHRQHRATWMGPELATIHHQAETKGWDDFNEMLKLSWRDGFITEARVATWYDWKGPSAGEMLKAVLKAPASRFLRQLAIGNLLDDSGMADYGPFIQTIAEAGPHPSLRHVHIGDFEYPEDTEISWTEVGDASPLYPAAPNLESLHLQGGSIFLGQLRHARLRRLKLETGGLPAGAIRSLAAADLPELMDLEVWLGDENYGAEATVDMFAPILTGELFPKLKKLGLKNGEIADGLARALVDSELLSRIESLALSRGTMTDKGAQVLLDHADKLKHLTVLDLSDNYIGDACATDLRQSLGTTVNVTSQDEPDEDDGELYAYVSVGE